MEPSYTPVEIEKKWQQHWAEQGLDRTIEDPSKPKFYALSMFPYPSGTLHMGHVRNYTITDVIARLQRMRGYRVLHPMGWDAFGLPAENAAIDRGIHPATWTHQNIGQMKQQLSQLGLSYDWDRELATCSPDYYRWTQWLFLEFFNAGLAYQKESAVNWDPIDQTVLANEQVDAAGRSWRSGALVERKLLRQWFFKITDYAERLLQDLDELAGWPERVRLMQENWIGKSTGARVVFTTEEGQELPVFTTRPDTLWGATFLVLSPEHPLVPQITTAAQQEAVSQYQTATAAKSDIDRTDDTQEKTGVWTGNYGINPVNQAKIPIWIADYVLMGYGTGAIMAVPAHDQRDFDFAQRFGLEIKVVVQPPDWEPGQPLTTAWAGEGTLVNSGLWDGLAAGKGQGQSVPGAIAHLEAQGIGQGQVTYRLRDWLISRQRYWGVPIPVIHCDTCGPVAVPEEQLPVLLPDNVAFSGRGPSPLAQLSDWIAVDCPCCGQPARRETDTMDTFIDSSWYYLRYGDAQNSQQIFDPAKVNSWLPVDQYVGGIEHAILHLLYSRFVTKVLYDRGLLQFQEPFQKLLTQGMVQAATYKNPATGKYIPPEQVSDRTNPTDPDSGEKLEVFYEKMSKSKYNGVDPQTVVQKYGADTARMFILFKAPPEKDLEWDDADVEGQFRFLNRVWRLVATFQPQAVKALPNPLPKAEKDLRRAIHTAIGAITEDLEGDYQFNTAVSELMKLSNALQDSKLSGSLVYQEGIFTLVKLLAPFAPHLCEELWQRLGRSGSIHQQPWPVVDPEALVVDEITLVIQVMGKTRGTIQVPAGSDQGTLEQLALASEVAQRYIDGKTIRKTIVVPGKLVNIVVG
ncbi:leucine--tRNA ligase [Prochlorothrix hollandica]|uniref:leucine--tRNA ligase n=1 Tax=Prochlorothrix hollandica TaxID=1223 RepID=UPI003DA78225